MRISRSKQSGAQWRQFRPTRQARRQKEIDTISAPTTPTRQCPSQSGESTLAPTNEILGEANNGLRCVR